MTANYIDLYTKLVNRRKGKKAEVPMKAVVNTSAAR